MEIIPRKMLLRKLRFNERAQTLFWVARCIGSALAGFEYLTMNIIIKRDLIYFGKDFVFTRKMMRDETNGDFCLLPDIIRRQCCNPTSGKAARGSFDQHPLTYSWQFTAESRSSFFICLRHSCAPSFMIFC